MKELKCPNCGQVFQVDESGYAQIVQQVRDRESETELHRRGQVLAQKSAQDLAMARMEQDRIHSQELAKKDGLISEKQRIIVELQSNLNESALQKDLAVNQAVQELSQKSRAALDQKDQELADRDRTIAALQAELDKAQTEQALAVARAVQEKDQALFQRETEIAKLQGSLDLQKKENALRQSSGNTVL